MIVVNGLYVFRMVRRIAELVAPDTDRVSISENLARLPKTTRAVSKEYLKF